MRTVVMWVMAGVGTWIIVLAALDFVAQWAQRRRPVKGTDGKWRMP